MFQSQTALPHVLAPQCYVDPAFFQQEVESVLLDAWHLVGTWDELSNPGDFLTTQVLGIPIQVRNFAGQLSALSNVCVHRHALLSSETSGKSSRMTCQYHGWEYQQDGSTGRIPQAKNFKGCELQEKRLNRFQLQQVGQLILVNLHPTATPFDEWVGADFCRLLGQRFGQQWRLAFAWEPEYDANWKVPVENSLESYHVPNVHPHTFREDPAERSEHGLLERRTFMKTMLPFAPHNRLDAAFQRAESRLIRWLGYTSSGSYEQHHVFPNLLFSFTDAISLVNCILPETPTGCRARVRQFGRLPESGKWFRKICAKQWARLNAVILKRILLEDQGIFSAIQNGLQSSSYDGLLGACEERIHRFQEFVFASTVNKEARND